MKHSILALMALAFSTAVAAEWMKVGETKNYEVFIDPDTISIDGHLRKAWQVRNQKMQNRGDESDEFRMEYDCKEERNRTLYWSVHSEHFALGALKKLALESSHWSPIRPYSIDWDILKIACAKQPN